MIIIKKIALIPAYEPPPKFIEILKELKENEFDIVVIDDGSGKEFDKTFEEVKKYAKVISYNPNKGKGIALKIGLEHIKYRYDEDYIVITMDCDGQHTVQDSNKLYSEVLKDKDMLILGKRVRNDLTPTKSKIGNAITRYIYKTVSGIDVYDTQTGLRAFSNNLIDFLLSIKGNGYEYEMNVLLECPRNDIKIKETEIETIYIDNNSNSHFKAFKDSIKIYSQIFKYLFKIRK